MLLPLRVQSGFRPAHAGGLSYVGVRTSSPGQTDRTKTLTASIDDGYASVVNVRQGGFQKPLMRS